MEIEAFIQGIEPLIQWIGANPNWAGFSVFLISLSESLAIVGLLVPGVVMMTGIGILIGKGTLPFWGTLLWAILGAIAGDGISYWLGYHYHEHLRDFWPFKQFPQLLTRGETFFKNHGGKSVIIGRFGPIRPIIPVIAGMMDMSPKRFLFFNIVSAIAWAPAYTLPGIMIGVSLSTLSTDVAIRVVSLILLFLLALWILYTFILKIGISLERIISRSLSKLWVRWQTSNHLPWLHQALRPQKGSEESQLGILFLFVITVSVFSFTIFNIKYGSGLVDWNDSVYQLLRALYVDKAIDWVAIFTILGDPLTLLPAAFAVAIWLFWRKRYFAFACWVATIFGGMGIGYLFKHWIAMPRPEGLVGAFHGYSFPSGHVFVSTLVFGFSSVLIHYSLPKEYRKIPWTISIVFILLIALSRLYLGVHWFTDILGGLSLGVSIVCLGALIYRRFDAQVIPIRAILLPGLIVYTLATAHFIIRYYPHMRLELKREWQIHEFKTQQWWTHDSEALYRTGAIKRVASQFNVEWLGSLDKIQNFLIKNGWKTLPKLSFQSALSVLAKDPAPETIPVLPRFHRGRLPMLVFSKTTEKNQRLVLQLWQSDSRNEQNQSLWVGSIHIEELTHPMPLISLYQDSATANQNPLEYLAQELKKSTVFQFQISTPVETDSQKVLLIK